jgi:perosamine synthetase
MTYRIPLARTDIGVAESAAVARVMENGRLALGPEMAAFEQAFADYHGVSGAVMVNSGTSGLMVALMALGVGPGDEVLMPALTFVGTINSILNAGATPVLVDVDPKTANIDYDRIEAAISDQTRAIMPVHLYGLAVEMSAITDIAEARALLVVEDACEAIGADYRGRKVGAIGDAGVFGFYPNKMLTTGEGGMVIADDPALLDRCRAIVNQGRGVRNVPGYSLRGTELAAAIGQVQLASLDERLTRRQGIADAYVGAIHNVSGVEILARGEPRSWFTFPVLLPEGADRERVIEGLREAGIEAADYFQAIHKIYSGIKSAGDLSVSETLGRRTLCLPLWDGVEKHIEEITTALTKLL